MKTVSEMEYDIKEFNPDGMNQDEIVQWINAIGNGLRPAIAKRWFPGVKGQYAHARAMRNYLWNKSTAMGCRLRGEIQTALQYEAICDRIYGELPAVARW